MSETTLPRELALRVGLAARAMPDMSTSSLLDVLDKAVGLPLTISKLDCLTVKTFRKAGGEAMMAVPGAMVRTAVGYLKGAENGFDCPDVEAYVEGDLPGSLRVACASNGGELLDGHFGSCKQFLIYQVAPSEIRLIAVRPSVSEEDSVLIDDVNVDKNALRAKKVSDCQILYVVSIGGPPVAKVIRAGVHPIKRPNGGNARVIASELMQVLKSDTIPPWLAKVLGKTPLERARIEISNMDGIE
ncbi:MAG: dinitrogenase iron-molybdenum cofactor biosynthesis protein [Hyphomicrobiaceae bacterium]|nr:dinitrogenase iron-molybdenum cofactor biosynthesis protein [Hyphomicrobiaceae bacterium]